MTGAVRHDEPLVHLLWINAGLGCDGNSVALGAATRPSIEETVLGRLPRLPRLAVHWPLLHHESGPEQGADTSSEWFHKADRGELACTMPGFPDTFPPFMDERPGGLRP